MKKLMILAAALLVVGATSAQAENPMGGLGFRSLNGSGNTLQNSRVSFTSSPTIGVRQWFSDQIAMDFAVGFMSVSVEGGSPSVKTDEGTGWAVDAGIPFVAKKLDKVFFILRPGFQYGRAVAKDKLTTTLPNKFTNTFLAVTGELEVEYMLTDKLSLSAAHGIRYFSIKAEDNFTPKRETKLTGFDTTGDNFTQLGFHVYLW